MDIIDIAIQEITTALPAVCAIYLFGSFGTEYQTDQSDLDLAVLASSEIDSLALWNLAQQTAVKIRTDVEIIDLMEASTVFRFHILTEGKRVYCSNPSYCDAFENTALSMYLRFNEERKEILEDWKHG